MPSPATMMRTPGIRHYTDFLVILENPKNDDALGNASSSEG
jgi:hypothetical protein